MVPVVWSASVAVLHSRHEWALLQVSTHPDMTLEYLQLTNTWLVQCIYGKHIIISWLLVFYVLAASKAISGRGKHYSIYHGTENTMIQF